MSLKFEPNALLHKQKASTDSKEFSNSSKVDSGSFTSAVKAAYLHRPGNRIGELT